MHYPELCRFGQKVEVPEGAVEAKAFFKLPKIFIIAPLVRALAAALREARVEFTTQSEGVSGWLVYERTDIAKTLCTLLSQ